jgi:uncharacterized protein (TIGR04255 family)
VEQQPALPTPPPETFGPAAANQALRIELIAMPPLPRTWFLNEAGDRLVQIQHDRLVFNWRKAEAGEEYPRYPFMRQTFEVELTGYLDYLNERGLVPPTRFSGEVAYVNTITAGEVWKRHPEADRVFSQWRWPSGVTAEAEDVRFAQRFVFPNREGEKTGRLYVQADPVFSLDTGEPAFNLTLTARGGGSPDLTDLLDFFDAAREQIVVCFDAMTTPEMHRVWEKTNG